MTVKTDLSPVPKLIPQILFPPFLPLSCFLLVTRLAVCGVGRCDVSIVGSIISLSGVQSKSCHCQSRRREKNETWAAQLQHCSDAH